MIFNVDKFSYIARNPFTALTLWSRFRGMISNHFSEKMDAMVFPNCNAIHTFFMGQKLDVIFLSKDCRVLGLYESLSTWRPIVKVSKSYFVIELPEGMISKSETKIGDRVNLNMELSKEAIAKTKYSAILYVEPEVKGEVSREK